MKKATKETVESCIEAGAAYGDCSTKFEGFFGEGLLAEALEEWHPTLYESMPRNNDGSFNKTHGEYHSLVKLLGYWVPKIKK